MGRRVWYHVVVARWVERFPLPRDHQRAKQKNQECAMAKPRPTTRPKADRRPTAAKREIRIVVADSQAIDRGGMVGLLSNEEDFAVVGEAAAVEESIQQCRALKPDVLVLSLNLPGQEHGSVVPALRTALPNLRILALSERGPLNCLVLNPPSRRRNPTETAHACTIGSDCLQLAASQGAMATLRRTADPEELFRAVRAVAEGNAWYDQSTATAMLSHSQPGMNGDHAAPLSERELDVAALISEGLSNKEISSTLKISEPTVKKYVGRILVKLGMQDRLQAGLYVARNPLLLQRAGRAAATH
jgi:NarL family two-component system response regulator LiaR